MVGQAFFLAFRCSPGVLDSPSTLSDAQHGLLESSGDLKPISQIEDLPLMLVGVIPASHIWKLDEDYEIFKSNINVGRLVGCLLVALQ